MSLKLSIVTPVKKLVTDLEIESVTIPAYKGEMTVLDQHTSLVTTLETGILSYKEKGSTEVKKLVVSWGYCEILGDEISVLAETAETKSEINAERAKQAKANATTELSKSDDLEIVNKNIRKIKRAETRLTI